MKCPECGQWNRASMPHCTRCGSPLNIDEASRCAALVNAKHSTPYHMAPGKLFDLSRAEKFRAEGRLIITPGEEIELNK